jgi:hypothetical protein
MRLVLSTVALLLLLSVPAGAQLDEIGLYVDPSYSNCKLTDAGAGPIQVYVVQRSSGGTTASQFRIEATSGSTLSWIGDTPQHDILIGDTQNGISVAYGECKYGEILVIVINYFRSGTSAPCSALKVVPDPNSTEEFIVSVNCSSTKLEVAGSRLVINADGSCECGPTTEASNWGRIKAKYDD